MATPLIESEGDHSSDEDFSPGHLVIDMEGMGGVSPGHTHLVSDLKTIDRQICELNCEVNYVCTVCGLVYIKLSSTCNINSLCL